MTHFQHSVQQVKDHVSDAIQSLAAMIQIEAPSYDHLILMAILLLT